MLSISRSDRSATWRLLRPGGTTAREPSAHRGQADGGAVGRVFRRALAHDGGEGGVAAVPVEVAGRPLVGAEGGYLACSAVAEADRGERAGLVAVARGAQPPAF